jgi:arabinose-5-phosphate isomerase
LQLMESKSINGLPVIDENSKVIGALNMHNLLRAGVV